MATQKTSIALDKKVLAAAKKAAAGEGLSLSAFLSKLVEAHIAQGLKFEAMDRFVTEFASGHRLTKEARAAIEAEWNAPLKPVRPRRKKSAA